MKCKLSLIVAHIFEVGNWDFLLKLILPTKRQQDDMNLRFHYPQWKYGYLFSFLC